MSAMKSATLTTAVEQNKKQTATSPVMVTATGELMTEVQAEETEEEVGALLERIINTPMAAKSKKDEDEDDDDDDDFDDDDDDDDFDDDDDVEIDDTDFEEFDIPKSKPGTAGAAKKKDEDDFELEDDFDDFDDFDDDDDDDDF